MLYKSVKIKQDVNNFIANKNLCIVDFIIDDKNIEKNLLAHLKKNNIAVSEVEVRRLLSKEENELFISNIKSNPDYNVICKLDSTKLTSDTFRNYLSGLIKTLKKKQVTNLQVNLLSFKEVKKYFDHSKKYYQSVLEGLLLGNYSFDKYKSDKKPKLNLEVNIVTPERTNLTAILRSTKNTIDSVYFSRDLVNEPANILTPLELVNQSKKELSKYGVKVTAFNKNTLIKHKMNAILAVGNASTNNPYLLILHYKPKRKTAKKIALVGKGVTYDSGGLSIKPTEGMLEMKADMSGAATVIGTILAAAKNNLPVELIGYIPAVENMLAGNSYKPGDVITSYSGKTILVKDTDAEGRVVLADALAYACKQKPDQIIDFATLTGAVAVALGLFTAGVMTKNDELSDKLIKAGETTNELLWRLPFNDDYNKLLDTDIADISNLGPRWGGAITAGKFLEFFVDEKIPYAHIDLAGPALEHKYRNYTEKWCTAFGIRMMHEYLSNI